MTRSVDSTLVPDFVIALVQCARCTVHVTQLRGGNVHHLLENGRLPLEAPAAGILSARMREGSGVQ